MATSKTSYFVVFVALMILTAVTVAVAYVDLGLLNAYVAMTIAIVKGTIVVLFFMHVKESNRLTQVVVASGFLWLLILFALTLSDYLSRAWT